MGQKKLPERFSLLIVDDDELSLELMKDFFSKRGELDIYTAHDGQEAVELLRGRAADLVISDLQMPGFSGMEVLKEARRIDTDTMVIIITGFGSLETAIEAIKNGAYDYIAKPFKLVEMEVTVNNALERIRLVRANKGLQDDLKEVHAEMEELKSVQRELKEQIDQVEQQMKRSQKRIDEGSGSLETVFGETPPLHVRMVTKRGGKLNTVISELERLGRLKEADVISSNEFTLLKKRLVVPQLDG